MAQGHNVKSEELFLGTREVRYRTLGRNHPSSLETMNDLAVLYKQQTRYDDAKYLLLDVIKGRRLKLGNAHPHTLQSLNNLIELYEAWGMPEKAEEWRTKLP